MAPTEQAEATEIKEEEKTLLKEISEEELAKHNTEADCWIALDNLVLNLPADMLNEHPGGPDVVTCLAGKDATQDFHDIAHSDSAREWASKYIVGYKEGAPDEDKTRKALPTNAELRGGSSSGGGGAASVIVPAVIVVILAAVAFFVMKGD
mmetsp:Transcript_72610/g.132700  ORF Transcript_72610/g.132700 Transcript_72610/m.132700 type:complete len:151 (-) Transcript_72610:102-554(-)